MELLNISTKQVENDKMSDLDDLKRRAGILSEQSFDEPDVLITIAEILQKVLADKNLMTTPIGSSPTEASFGLTIGRKRYDVVVELRKGT